MGVPTILLLAVGLSMDAFAISITNGMCYRLPVWKNALYSGLAFGFFQGLMPLIGYFGGHTFSGIIESYDHWIALLLLGFIGVKMIVGALKEAGAADDRPKAFSLKVLGVQAVATSIDALAVGIGLGVMHVNIIAAVCMIAVTTFTFSFAGVFIGDRFGRFLKEKAEIFGGVILVLIGMKIFLEHMGIIG